MTGASRMARCSRTRGSPMDELLPRCFSSRAPCGSVSKHPRCATAQRSEARKRGRRQRSSEYGQGRLSFVTPNQRSAAESPWVCTRGAPDFDYSEFLNEIRDVRASHVAISSPRLMDDWQSNDIHPVEGRTASWSAIQRVTRGARDRGLSVAHQPRSVELLHQSAQRRSPRTGGLLSGVFPDMGRHAGCVRHVHLELVAD